MARSWLSIQVDLVVGHCEHSGPDRAGSSPPPALTHSLNWRVRSTMPSRAGIERTSTVSS